MVSQLDSLLTQLGTGKWTILHFFAMAYISMFLAPITLGGAFLAPRLAFTCRRPPAALTPTPNTTFATPLPNATLTPAQDECQYKIHTPDGEKVEDCLEFDFDNSTFYSTITAEYNLVCGRSYLQTIFQSLYMFGVFVGAPINGYLSDKYGRKSTLVVGVVAYMVISLVSSWLPLLSLILVCRFLVGCLHAVCCYTSYILMVEVMEPKLRTAAGYLFYIVWAFGVMLYGGVGYLIRDWRILQTTLILPALPLLPALWLIDESPRWLIVNGRHKEAFRTLGKVARWHGVDLPSEGEIKKMIDEQVSKVEVAPHQCSLKAVYNSFIGEALVLVRTPQLRTITLCVYLDYLMASMVYFGLSLSGASISDDPFLYMVLSGAMEIPAYIFTSFIVQRFGRKRTLSFFLVTSAVILLSLAVTPTAYTTTIVILAMVGKLGITGGFQTIIFFSSELFPTEVRSRGIGTSFMMSRIGSMVSPFITDLVGSLYPWAPFVIFGSGALVAGAGTFLLPETRGQVLPDTIVQLEERTRKGRQ